MDPVQPFLCLLEHIRLKSIQGWMENSSITHDDSLSNFFLSLGPTSEMDDNNNVFEDPGNLDPGYERMIHWSLLPIRCETSLKQRWDAFRSILMNEYIIPN